jgi:predicted phage terminase large subunit-like protein
MEAFTESLMDFIPRVTPRYERPLHMAPFIDALERAPGGNLRICFSAPPQHVKTSVIQNFLAKLSRERPELRNAYATYSADRAQRVGRGAAAIADSSGLDLAVKNLDLWRTREGGQTLWTSVGGGMTGEACDGVAVIDDPLKDRKEAESPTVRENHKDWFHSVLETRVHPGASIIVMMTRWHPDDLVGYLVKNCGFEYINLKAIADTHRPPGDNRQPGEALWPSKRPLEMLLERRASNEWNFAAMYQGEPRPRGGSLFREPTYWHELPESGFKVSFGVDLSYTEKTHADFSVCVEVWAVPPQRGIGADEGPNGWLFYVTDVQRKQVEAPSFALTLRAKSSQRPGKFYWYASGTEKGSAQFIKAKGIPLTVMDPKGRDKYTRAQQTSELWNNGRILVPSDSEAYPWADVFTDEVTSFTGVKDLHDDQVDALVAAIDAALAGKTFELPGRSGGGRWG